MTLSRCAAFTAISLLASACPRTPSRASDAATDAATELLDAATGTDAIAAADTAPEAAPPPAPPHIGWVHPARLISVPALTSTSREDFLLAHGITRDNPDTPCWSSLLGTKHVACECDRSFEVTTPTGAMDVLVCTRGTNPPASSEFLDMGMRSVLYGAINGTLKLLLDAPTYVTVGAESAEPGEIVGSVDLLPMPSANGVTFVDTRENDQGPWCPQAVQRAAAQRGHDWPLIHRRFAAVCATAGRYVLKDGRLVKDGRTTTP